MVVRQKVGRKRYIAFEIVSGGEGLTRGRMIRAIEHKEEELAQKDPFEVILMSGNRGIVRTGHRTSVSLAGLLGSFDRESDGMEIRTLSTSGTIRRLKKDFFSAESGAK